MFEFPMVVHTHTCTLNLPNSWVWLSHCDVCVCTQCTTAGDALLHHCIACFDRTIGLVCMIYMAVKDYPPVMCIPFIVVMVL